HHQAGHVDFGPGAAEHRNRYHPPVVGETVEIALRVATSDHVQADLRPFAPGDHTHPLDEVVGLVVDRMIGPNPKSRVAFRVAAASDDHRQAEQLAELDRHAADAAGAAVDQQRLPVGGPAALEYVVPDCEQGFR